MSADKINVLLAATTVKEQKSTTLRLATRT
jgi:hypothetical protein